MKTKSERISPAWWMIVFAVLFSAGFLVIISIFNVAENRKYDISITDMNEG